MTKNTKNIAASTHQRLLNIAKDSSRPFNELLQHFAIERFMYRLTSAPKDFEVVVTAIKLFLEPLTLSLTKDRPFRENWNAPGPWRE